MKKAVISKKLYALLESKLIVKLNGVSYDVWHPTERIEHEDRGNYEMDYEVSEFNFFCYNKQNKITCWPISKGEQPLNENGQWKKEGRQELKPGRFLLLLKDKLMVKERGCGGSYLNSDGGFAERRELVIARACEVFTEKVRGSNEELVFEIGEYISKIYKTPAHAAAGYLLNSCMQPDSGHSCRFHSKFYDFVPGLKIVYRTIQDQLLFRALLWQEAFIPRKKEVVPFLDRVYGSELVNHQLREKAEENGWAFRSFGDNTIIWKGQSINLVQNLTPEAINYLQVEGAPYVDTLYHVCQNEGVHFLSNDRHNSKYCLQDPGGNIISLYGRCDRCGEPFYEEGDYTPVYGEGRWCENCTDDYADLCEQCGEYYPEDDVHSIRTNGQIFNFCGACASDRGFRPCHHCGTWEEESEMRIDHYDEDDFYYCMECVNSHFTKCSICGELRYKSQFSRVRVDRQTIKVCYTCANLSLASCYVCGEKMSGVIPFRLDNTNTPVPKVNDRILCPSCHSMIRYLELKEKLLEEENMLKKFHFAAIERGEVPCGELYTTWSLI